MIARSLLLVGAVAATNCAAQPALRSVAFVGCAGDGQTGPVAAPPPESVSADLNANTASELAFYKGHFGGGILAPKGWHCFLAYGSSGETLTVAPTSRIETLRADALAGPAVALSEIDAGTSGRFGVAAYGARLFPNPLHDFIEGVIAEDIEPREDFPSGPYPADRLIRKSAKIVEYETPGVAEGIGTSGPLAKSALPVVGAVILNGSFEHPDSMSILRVRLPPELDHLRQAIVVNAERSQ